MSLLVTGFGPFRDIAENPSALLAERSGGEFRVLEVAWRAVDEFVESLPEQGSVLMIGVAAGRKRMTPELLAHNRNGDGADVREEKRPGEIVPGGAPTLRSRLWESAPLEDWYRDGICTPSGSAGGYLCNYIAYRMASARPNVASGFLHVPHPDDMPLEEQLSRLHRIIADLRR